MSSRRKTISEFCTSDRDCAFGLHCGGTGVCASGTTGNSAGQSCSNSPQCQVGLSCISGICSSPSTTPTTTPSISNSSSNNPVISTSTNSTNSNNNLVNRNNSGSITGALSRFLSGGTNAINQNNNQVNQNNLANRNSQINQNNGCNNVTNQSSGNNLNNNSNSQINQNNNLNNQNNNSSNQNNQVLGSYTPPSQSQFTRSFIISYYNGKRNYLIVPSNGNPSFWSPDLQMQFTLFGDRGVLYAHEGTRDYPVEVTRSGYLVRSKMSSVFSLDENNRLVYNSNAINSNNNFGVNNNNFVNNVGNNSLQIDENGKAYFITPSNINSVSEGGMDARITLY